MTRKQGSLAWLRLLLATSLVFSVAGFNIKLNSLLLVDLTANASQGLVKPVFSYPPITQTDTNERFKLIQTDKNSNYVMFGARNRIVVIAKNTQQFGSPLQVYESFFPSQGNSFKNRNCSDRACANYILTSLPLNKSKFNILVCGTYYGLFQCLQGQQNKKTGLIDSYDELDALMKAPKSVNLPLSNENALHLSFRQETSDFVLYAASSWTDTSQYLSAHVSDNFYQDDGLSKKIGVSKSFVKFVEANDRLFLFQNELSYDIDDGEKDRDILISTSLVTQICKNDEDIVNREAMPFYSELTAKIYCFNDAFKSSGNSRMFKFDSLDFVTDLINLSASNRTRRLFYGVFNTPKNQITGTAICLFDIDDLAFVFQKKNFKFLDDNGENNAKNSLLNPQDCPKVSYMEKLKYKSFTSKLSYMTKSALPVRKRKASFMTTNDYRITSLFVLDDHVTLPAPNYIKSLKHMNVIYAGTDNGKLLRIVHHFSDDFFSNDDPNEESVEILEEIQLFDLDIKINQITLLNDAGSGIAEKLVVSSDQQIKIVGVDFCELFSESCDSCLKLNHMSEFRTKCMWRNGSCKTAAPTTNPALLQNCDFLKPSTTVPPRTSQPSSPSTTFNWTETSTKSSHIKTSHVYNSTLRRPIFSAGLDEPSNEFVVSMPDQTELDASIPSRITNSSAPVYFNGFLDHKSPSVGHFADFNKLGLVNGSFFPEIGQTVLRRTKSDPPPANELMLFVLVSVTASLCMLVLGMLIGYALKAKYSKTIMRKFDSLLRRSSKPAGGDGSGGDPLSIAHIEGLHSNTSVRKFNPYQFATATNRPAENSSLLYSSVGQKTSSSSSSGASSERCSRQNSNASGAENKTTLGHVKLMKSKNLINRDYFTVQNDYGLLPASTLTAHRHYLKPPPPIAPPQLPLSHRLSSTSSTTTANSASEVASETTTSTHISPVSRLVMSSTTTDSSYPAVMDGPSGGPNCIVVNDDDDEELSDGQHSSIHKASKSSSSSLSQNPSNRSSASSSGSSSSAVSANWASLTRISHQNRYYKHQTLGGKSRPSLTSSSPPTRNVFVPSRPGKTAEPQAAIYMVKSRLTSLLSDDLLANRSRPNVATTSPIKLEEGSIYLNNSYV